MLDVFEAGGELEAFLAEEPAFPSPSEIKDCSFFTSSTGLSCEGLSSEKLPAVNQMVVTVPRECLGRPAWVRAAAATDASTHPDAQGRFRAWHDYWAPRGIRRHGFLPPFGPRVHAS